MGIQMNKENEILYNVTDLQEQLRRAEKRLAMLGGQLEYFRGWCVVFAGWLGKDTPKSIYDVATKIIHGGR